MYWINEDVSTIYLTGLPSDVTSRELRALFRFAPGFEAAVALESTTPLTLHLLHSDHWSPWQRTHLLADVLNEIHHTDTQSLNNLSMMEESCLVGFAKFACRQDAIDARQHLNGKPFDPENPQEMMRVEFAGRNLSPISTEGRTPAASLDTLASPPLQDEVLPPPIVPARSFSSQPLLQGVYYNPPTRYSPFRRASSGSQHLLQMNNCTLLCENPPCNTLYVGNLPPNAAEEELRELFAPFPGFKRMSFKEKPAPAGPMCFVEFESVQAATTAMTALYGTMLSSSTKGGIRLSYSKNPLGVRSNANSKHSYDDDPHSIYVYHPVPVANIQSEPSI